MSIITRLNGGLGNQMFQYAAGRALAYKLNLPLKLDISVFEKYELRTYKLNHFSIEEDIADENDLDFFSIPDGGLGLFFFRMQNFFRPWHLKKNIVERERNYDNDFVKIKKSCLMRGYWQSEKYFKDIEGIIRNDFKLNEEPDKVNREILSNIRKCCSVSVHIRRGDYVNNPAANKVHGFLGVDYYEKAISYFETTLENPVFFVFSDDIDWAKKNIKTDTPLFFVDHNGEERDYEDLRLLMNCQHHIIANSSFSWWGAWLSSSQHKKVIAPKNWFTREEIRKNGNNEIVPDRWMKI